MGFSLKNTWLRFYNAVDYPLRQFFRWRRGGLKIRPRHANNLFTHLPLHERTRAEELAKRLQQQYHLEAFYQDSTPVNYRENLFYLHLLESALDQSGANLPQAIQAADIGPSHWFYVQALHALLRWWRAPEGRLVHLTGYETDAYCLYRDLHSCYDHAMAHMRDLSGVEYLSKGFTRQPGQYHLITMLFPFVFEKDHLQWGLPGRLFQPELLLADAWESLKTGGVLIIANQGKAEHEAQLERMLEVGIQPQVDFWQDPLLYTYDYDRYVLAAIRS